jgi:hypothetical protein
MGLLSWLCPSRESENDEFDICDTHGHDFRESVEVEKTVKKKTRKIDYLLNDYETSDQVVTFENYGKTFYTYLKLRDEKLMVCRDCGVERTFWGDTMNLVLCEDGEYRPFNDLFTEIEEEENNA